MKLTLLPRTLASPSPSRVSTGFINDSLLEGAIDALKRIGQVKDENITVVWVPGAYELPLAAGALAKTGKYDAVNTLGTVMRGGTAHLKYVTGVVQATAWRMLPRTAKFRLLLGF